MKNKVPDRWEEYKNMGRQIPGTRFICFKVPLREEILQNAMRKTGVERFCPRTLMDHCQNLGLIVDLTYTNRFYDPNVFTDQGIEHTKIFTRGKVIPDKNVIKQFYKAVDGFLDENKKNDKLIGVHCTHGLNRSGYLVCRYMIENLGIPPDQAISDFNSARGHEQEREEYLTHLRQMKWQQEPPADDSSDDDAKEEKESYQQSETPFNNRRRSKRSFDAMRSEDGEDDSWPTGPVRKWPRTPRTERRYNQSYYEDESPSTSYHSGSRRTRHKVKTSPYEAQRYYDSYYQGRVAPQYDSNFYQQQGSGIGPHRPSPRWSKNVRWDNNGPRQYQGPRQYKTPPQRERETLDQSHDYSYNSPLNYGRNGSQNMQGPRRNPFSPGANDNVFSPVTPRYRRHRK